MRVGSPVGIAAAAVLVLALAGCQGEAQAPDAPALCPPTPAAVAHRGGTERAMENTVGAFTAAGDAGIRTWEIDVRFDVHGTPVVLHDPTVDRVSPQSGPITELDADDGGIATDDGQYVPTLREVYDLALRYRAQVLTELKVMPTAEQWTDVAAQVDATIGRSAVTLMSFERRIVLEGVRQVPGTHSALIHQAGYLSPEQIKQYGGAFNKFHVSISESRAAEWHAAGVRLYAWTVNKEADWERLKDWPVDGVITDRPIGYQQWAAARCEPHGAAGWA
jgi:glycerophosphoryl diester phosphodiesterase